MPKLIKSIRAQADEHCRIMFVDDASSDDTTRVIEQSCLNNSSVSRNYRNIGLYGTINASLSQIFTEYTCLIFQDDLLSDNYLRQMRWLTLRHPEVNFLWPEIMLIDEGDNIIAEGLNTGREELITPGRDSLKMALDRGTFWTISGSVSKTERLRHYGFRADLPHCADYDFLLRAIQVDEFLYFERPLTCIRIHKQQASEGNLRDGIDLKERVRVFSAHRAALHDVFSRFEFIYFALKEWRRIVRRSAGQALRGRLGTAFKIMLLIPALIRGIV